MAASNQIDFGALYDMYDQVENQQRTGNQLEQVTQDAANREYINQAFRAMEEEAYRKVDKGEKADLSQTSAFKDLMERFKSQSRGVAGSKGDGSQVAAAPWERLLPNPEVSERPEGFKDPWSQIMSRLSDAQANANFQTDFKTEQQEWQDYQKELAEWAKEQDASKDAYYKQLGRNPDAEAARSINAHAEKYGGIGAGYFFTPEGKADIENMGRGGWTPEQEWTPPNNKPRPSLTGKFGTDGSVAAGRKGNRRNEDEEPLF